MRFVTPKPMVGVSKLAVVMPGEKYIARKMTWIAAVGNSALRVSGVRLLTHQIMASKYDGLSTTALPRRTSELRLEI